jgi:hypothetical protein
MFISPLDSVTPLDSHGTYSSAPTNQYLSSVTPPIPPSTYSGSPAPSDFSLPLHAPQPQRVFESSSQTQMKGNMANLDVDMTAYVQGLANFNIPLDMGLSYVVPEMPPLSFDVSGQLFADALQQQQQRQAQQLPMTAPIAVPVDAGFTFNDAINEF